MNIIFLGGVHGVGKSHLGGLVAEDLAIPLFTASRLIREENSNAVWNVDKRVLELDKNQQSLIRKINLLRAIHNCILLDGHFVLKNVQNTITPISLEVFKALNLTGVVLLEDSPKVIAERLFLRDNCETDYLIISELLEAELSHARMVCDQLDIPLSIIHTPTIEKLTSSIKTIQLS